MVDSHVGKIQGSQGEEWILAITDEPYDCDCGTEPSGPHFPH